jgi:NADH-quinone oxidoreductase subunit A
LKSWQGASSFAAMENTEISEFGNLLLFITGAIVFVLVSLQVGRLVRPSRPNKEKLSAYECGEEPAASSWGQFNTRFYLIALIFLIFEAELIFLFPWGLVMADATFIGSTSGSWKYFTYTEILIFVFVLALGLSYVWAKGYLNWVKPKSQSQFDRPKGNIDRTRYVQYRPPLTKT